MRKLRKMTIVVLTAAGGIFTAQEASAFFWKFFDNDNDYYRDYPYYTRYGWGGPYSWGGPYGWGGGPYGWGGPFGWGGGGYPGYGYPWLVQSSGTPEVAPPPMPE